jgi:iron complex outermembrane receptor protein
MRGGSSLSRLCGAAAVAALVCAAPFARAAQAQPLRIDLPAQSLGSALRAFAQASNQQIIFSENAVRGKESRSLTGAYSLDDGLRRLLAGSGLAANRTTSGVIYVSPLPQAAPDIQAQTADQPVSELVVTGSRIRRADIETAAPVAMLDEDSLIERGYTNLGQLLNQVTSNVPQLPISASQGFPAGDGKTSPNLFNLGVGRTLTLVNGRRMVATSSGLGDRSVDAGAIPFNLIKRVEIVQAGGAAVYGSDAIAGVVNYVLKDDYEGLELNAQYGISSRSDNPKYDYSLLWGRNFADGRGNIAVDLEYSKTRPLLETDRPATAGAVRTVPNLANLSTTDGQPPSIYVSNGRLWQYNPNGVLFAVPSGSPASLLRLNGQALQFSANGHVVPYDTGVIQGTSSVAIGGDGLDTRALSTLGAGLERWNLSAIGHYDLTDHVKVSGELIYGRQVGYDPIGTQQIFRTINNTGPLGPILFNRDNPFLSAQDVATLSAASPAFASGQNLYLGRYVDALPSRDRHSETDVWRGVVALDGDFRAMDRDFYYSASFSRGQTEGMVRLWAPWLSHLDNALNATRDAAGRTVCAINADAMTANDDPGCVPLDPFGTGTITPAAAAYVSTLTGQRYRNIQDDFLATLGGDVVRLPAGLVKFSLAYEHRAESVAFRPFQADLLGLATTGSPTVARDGAYHTNEFSGELLVPIVGGGFTLPLVQALELDGSYRDVDNSIAGRERVWGVGGRWEVGYGLTLRASHSRNFRAPSLDQLFAPQSTATGQPLGSDPCDADRINGGAFPATRLKNCQALFAANPAWGPLATFQDPAENTGILAITSGGNPNLKNEVSKTTTYGLAFQPRYVPGLAFTADRIRVFLRDGFVSLSPASFAAACYDNDAYPADICGAFTRNPANGWITQGTSTTFNAGFIRYQGEVYNLSYRFPLGSVFGGRDLGTLELAAEGTHTTLFETQTVGFRPSRTDDTVAMPDWRVRFDLRYARGPLRLFWSVYYLPPEKMSRTATIETDPTPKVKANATHTVSAQYALGRVTLRAGVNNLFDQQPSFPTRTYGDIYGRQYFMGLRARF